MAKVLISIEDHLLARVDAEARRRGVSRSKLVGELASRGLTMAARADRQQVLDKLRALFRGATYADARDSTQIVREMRDSR